MSIKPSSRSSRTVSYTHLDVYKRQVKSCGTRDTLKIARELGIHLHFLDNLNDLLGMYTYRHKERHILLNSNMEYLLSLIHI